MLGTVALVGRPSAGKSTIFNRIVGERRSIVEETPGVTRDRLYAHAEWLTKQFTVIDTGGIQLKDAPFQTEIRAQCEIAMEEADLVVFVTDAHGILTDDDRLIARMLHQKKKKTILVANKIDNIESIGDMAEYYRLGFGEPMAVSGVHGIGIGDLLDRIVKELPEREVPDYQGAISFSLIGRPNVGKSSLVNRLIGQERSIVASIEGTTRDSTDTPFERDGTNDGARAKQSGWDAASRIRSLYRRCGHGEVAASRTGRLTPRLERGVLVVQVGHVAAHLVDGHDARDAGHVLLQDALDAHGERELAHGAAGAVTGELEGNDTVLVDAVILHIAAVGLQVRADLLEDGKQQLLVDSHRGLLSYAIVRAGATGPQVSVMVLQADTHLKPRQSPERRQREIAVVRTERSTIPSGSRISPQDRTPRSRRPR